MARIRSIKPEFFLHDGIAELPVLTRLLFIGLWTHCDAQGRCEDRPRRIKAAILPYDDCDCDAMLTELASAGFIVRYESQGDAYIAIPTWSSHQRITGKEAETASRYPAPGKQPGASQEPPDQVSDLNRETPEQQPEEPQIEPEKQRGNNGETTGKQLVSLEGKGKDRKGEESKYVEEEGCGEKPKLAIVHVGSPPVSESLWWLDDPGSWEAELCETVRSSKGYGEVELPEEQVRKLVASVKGFCPDREAFSSVLEAFAEDAQKHRKPKYSSPVKALRNWFEMREARWREILKSRGTLSRPTRPSTLGSAQTLIDRLGDQVAL